MFNATEREGQRRRHQVDTMVEGIGINRVTANFEVGRELIDDAINVTDEQALAMARWLVEKDGIFVGSSSCVNCEFDPMLRNECALNLHTGFAAVKVARAMGPGHRIVTILCDSGTRHISKFWAYAGNVGGKSDTSLEDVIGSNG